MTSFCKIDLDSVIEITTDTFYWYCNTCKKHHREIFNDGDILPYKSTITVITEEEYNKVLTYSRL